MNYRVFVNIIYYGNYLNKEGTNGNFALKNSIFALYQNTSFDIKYDIFFQFDKIKKILPFC